MGLRTFLRRRFNWAYQYGFKKSTIRFCGITKENYRDYLSDASFQAGHPWNGLYSSIIDNKLYLPYLFKDYPEYIPQFLYFKDRYGFLPLTSSSNSPRISTEDFLSEIRILKRAVLKAVCGEVGRGFLLLELSDLGEFLLNKKIISSNELESLLNELDNYIIQAYVEQHHELSAINPTSLNTLRVVLIWNPDRKTFVVGPCFHRFGCNGNVVDNLGSGNGLLVYVDSKTGKYMNYGVLNVQGKGESLIENVTHPNSGFVFSGKDVINFNTITEKLVEIMNSMSFLNFVALDIAIKDDGFCIIETNSYPDPAIAQFTGGWLKDPDISPYFKR